jgi:hypothetical protein
MALLNKKSSHYLAVRLVKSAAECPYENLHKIWNKLAVNKSFLVFLANYLKSRINVLCKGKIGKRGGSILWLRKGLVCLQTFTSLTLTI